MLATYHRFTKPVTTRWIAFTLTLIGALALAAPFARAQTPDNSADEVVFWSGFSNVAELTDAKLDGFASMGVDSFVMSSRQLSGMGNPAGDQDWTDDPNANLNSPRYTFQRTIRDSRIVQRAAARGIELYLGFWAVNYKNQQTPYAEWFDDAGWDAAAGKLGDMAGAARMLGFKGLAIDQELYPQVGGVKKASWNWDYPGNTHSEAEVRAQVKQRGEQAMEAILEGFPGVEVGVYNFLQDDSALELFYDQTSKLKNRYAPRVDLDWWNGMTSVEGYGAIRQWNSVFYKDWRFGTAPGTTLKWENAMRWDVSQTAALLSKRFDNWDYAESRYYSSPFSWINAGPLSGTWDNARPVSYVKTQLEAMRKFGMGRGFANYHYGGGLDPSAYSSYKGALQAASKPGVVDDVVPTVTDASAKPDGVEGAAVDDLAVWSVRWEDSNGNHGTAALKFSVESGSHAYIQRWQMNWSVPANDLSAGAEWVDVTAVDIHGNESAPERVALASTPNPGGSLNLTAKPPKRLETPESRPTVRFAFSEPTAPAAVPQCRIDRQGWSECADGAAAYRLRARDRWKRHRFAVRTSTEADTLRYRFHLKRG